MAESWGKSAAGLGSDLHLELTGPGGVRASLTRALREAIRGGRLVPGSRLPPYRTLAVDLGVARNTVAEAYAELVAEGGLTARRGAGTRVAQGAVPPPPATVRRPTRPSLAARPTFDLMPGAPHASAFPRAAWLTSSRRALAGAPSSAFGVNDARGRAELRGMLAEYLARARGVRTDPEHIVICAGFAHGVRLLAEVLAGVGAGGSDRDGNAGAGAGRGGAARGEGPAGPAAAWGRVAAAGPDVLTSGTGAGTGTGAGGGPTLAVESYGLDFHRTILHRAGLRTVPLPVDENGAQVAELAHTDARAVLLTPAHQYPTGGPLHPERRAAVLDWARAGHRLVIEDDYDGEFRYDRQPVGALQGLDPDRVAYVGSVSKSLSPAVRIGWLVLPDALVDAVLTAKGEREMWVGIPDQLVLADLLASGAYDRHVRRMRQRYRRRRDQLVTQLAAHAPHLSVSGIAAGLHAVLDLPPDTERSIIQAAAWQGLALDGLASYRHPQAPMPPRDGLVVGYGTPPDHTFAGALDALCRALPSAG
ncbi:PLP-dependent aminotransferase family protein [Streptomyces sp. HSW2009]|uniref:aminotransferase-like domain-containing protein n=1 Tax=Streptomyces sp. HSW2009 TaxID=3142890 RepID=UPI0032EABE99